MRSAPRRPHPAPIHTGGRAAANPTARAPVEHARTARAKLLTATAVVLAAALLLTVGTSYVRAITAPGYTSFADKTSSWLRDHGAGPLVDQVETWYYTRHQPSREAADINQFQHGQPAQTAAIALPNLPVPTGSHTPPRWVAGRTRHGRPTVYISAFEPDPTHPSIVTGVAIIDSTATTTHYMTGTQQPRSPVGQSPAKVPTTEAASLVAVFNSGFRFDDITGGVYAFGHEYKPLIVGQATATIDDHGRLDVGQWGRDVTNTAHLVAARQNLALIVDHAAALPQQSTSSAAWGGTHLQYQYTWRSGLGVDHNGNIVYVIGNHLDLATLATALADAGAVRAMQLDMHPGMSTFTIFTPTVSSPHRLNPTKLLPWTPGPATRYLTTDRRDFFYTTLAG
ncbi:hypothetical protein HH308_20780 [Gordonia sp. TBRC 11910]|uniref:Phosphodiester glycosidase domain-containing protein n=1 Tax=Gordonia asplenii TaxID=2725283 RepID=A0A848KY32_9ACTN|nr:hypothetical protein [Gordonia asplenii]NMO03654.1 hypothetical protein [Gordonia asplenii]